jgi:hypothetical protein
MSRVRVSSPALRKSHILNDSGTGDTRRYILNKFITDCSINRVSDITLPVVQLPGPAQKRWKERRRLLDLRSTGPVLVIYLVPRYLPATILEGFTVPEPAATKTRPPRLLRRLETTLNSSSLFTAALMPVFGATRFQKLK